MSTQLRTKSSLEERPILKEILQYLEKLDSDSNDLGLEESGIDTINSINKRLEK